MDIVLYRPQIPQNTGNVVRTCAVTGSRLVLVHPLGFSTSDRWLKRAGLDYWEGVEVLHVENLENWLASHQRPYVYFSSHSLKPYTAFSYTPDHCLIFGSETSGLPESWHAIHSSHGAMLPMRPNKRCLNLATAVGIAVYHAWGSYGFA